ncbi:S-adenosyl-L-methionine-dependent methyltransferase [Trametes elegans]|nr:S-adenosyl-L-methionine-dependent methyltransferase [Trametes elegans]
MVVLALRVQRCSCLRSRSAVFRSYSTKPSIPPLPPQQEWRTQFPINNTLRRERPVLSNPDTARLVAQSFLSTPASDSGGKIVIEAFPGPGALSRAMLELPSSKLKKLIILEEDKQYLNALKPLEEADSRVTILPLSGYYWDTYSQIEERGLLEGLQPQPWEGESPNLQFVAHINLNVKGEQLLAQFLRCIPEHSWLFQYGRVPMSLLLSDYVWQRLTAPPGDMKRCKLSVIGEAVAELQTIDRSKLEPYDQHFYPIPIAGQAGKSPAKRLGQPMHAFTAVPYAEQVIPKGGISKWDFVLRRLFVLKNTPLKNAVNSLAPGASSLLKDLRDPRLPTREQVKLSKSPKELTLADWALILRAYDNWPFKPEDIMITDAFMGDDV